MSAFEMLAFFRFIKFYNEGEITMVSVRKRGKVYEYRFEIATVEGTRKWITKSGYPTKAKAFKEGATPENQHWVAVTGVNGNNVIMVDPASNQMDMWSAYEWSKSSQFNYFKAE